MIRVFVIGRRGQLATELLHQCPGDMIMEARGLPEIDLTDPEAAAEQVAASGADLVINAAAYNAVDRAESEQKKACLVNAVAPAAMARAATALGMPFLHVSTDYVYDGTGSTPYTPDGPTGPLSVYGRSKLAGDLGVAAAGGTHVILRTSWVFSAHGGNFVKTMLRLGRARNRLPLVADQIGGPSYAGDIASALWVIARELNQGRGQSGIYHFAGMPDVSWADFAREIFAQAGFGNVTVEDIPTSGYPTAAARPANSRLDCTSLFETFGIARPDWRASLTKVLKDLGEFP